MSFEVTRSTSIAADPARVHALVNDFHEWQKWSPWEDVDPDLQRTYTGPDAGVGAHYAWSGNKKAGAGSMEITGSTPGAHRRRRSRSSSRSSHQPRRHHAHPGHSERGHGHGRPCGG